jgi:hypothetical protein
MIRRSAFRLSACLAWCLFLSCAGGCGPSRGTVSGKVTYKGKPVVWGTVTVVASDNMSYAGAITSEGAYAIPNVPHGPVKFCVTSPNPDAKKRPAETLPKHGGDDLPGADPAGALPPTGSWFPIPEKYADFQQSGLIGTVNTETVIDLPLQ